VQATGHLVRRLFLFLFLLTHADFAFLTLGFGFDVRGHVARASPPFYGRIREDLAKNSIIVFNGPIATGTLFHDRMAGPAVEITALFSHESAFDAFFDCSALHCCAPPYFF
jgi:hypothetical protein